MANIKGFMIFFGVTAVASVLILGLLRFIIRSPIKIQANSVSYDVMERSGKRIALRNSSKFSWLIGFTYAGLFYLSLPFMIWRYGKYRSIWFVAIPFVISFAISYLVASDGGSAMLLGIVLQIIIRAIGGLYIEANDLKFQKKTLVSRGWEIIGSCEATSSKNAMEFFKDSLKISGADNKEVQREWPSYFSGLKDRLSNSSK